jgi:hypothetical protein
MVPAAINTYLRDYQRDGVRFFWHQYQEGRGGLLGDDMGLVSDPPTLHLFFLTLILVAITSRVRNFYFYTSVVFTLHQVKRFKLYHSCRLLWAKTEWSPTNIGVETMSLSSRIARHGN